MDTVLRLDYMTLPGKYGTPLANLKYVMFFRNLIGDLEVIARYPSASECFDEAVKFKQLYYNQIVSLEPSHMVMIVRSLEIAAKNIYKTGVCRREDLDD